MPETSAFKVLRAIGGEQREKHGRRARDGWWDGMRCFSKDRGCMYTCRGEGYAEELWKDRRVGEAGMSAAVLGRLICLGGEEGGGGWSQ